MGIWLGRGAILLLALALGAMAWIRLAPDDPAVWHVDPLTAERTGKPNDCLAAPAGVTKAKPDIVLPSVQQTPHDLLVAFDRTARAAPRVTVLAGSVDDGFVTYVQRSLLMGYPDYISVRAVATGDGASLAVWSRARYGYSDMGVNRARCERWLKGAGLL